MSVTAGTSIGVFVAMSLDGFIADREGRLDWLEDAAGAGEDYGYDAFLAGVDALAMGRGTYDHIAGIEPLPVAGRPLFVFTHRPQRRAGVTFWDRTPREAVEHWRGVGLRRVYVDGGQLISDFLHEGLVDDMVITVVPLVLGGGHPLFHPGGRRTALALVGTRSWPSGMAQLRYVRA